MPPKTPKAKPRPTPRRISGAAAPEAPPAPTTSTIPVAATSAGEAVQTQPPIAPPAGRLDSLISPPTSSRSSQGGIAAGGAGSGRGAAIPLKFKPKNVPRKSKEEREALDAKFEITVVPIPRPRGGGSTRGPRGGRGGRSGFGRNDRQVTAGASGPFSLGSVTTRDRAQKITVERGNDFGRHRQLGVKGRTAAEPSSSKIKSEDPVPDNVTYSASSSDSEGPRMDVEYISLLDDARSDDEDDDMELEPMWGAGAPVRVPRSAHIDRAAQVNTEASSSRKWKFDLGRKGKEVLFEETVKVKDEPPDGDEGIAAPDVKSSPGTSRKKGVKTQSPETKKRGVPAKTRKRSSSRRRKTILSSLEDKEELEREETDRIATLMELAGGLARVKVDDGDDDGIAMADSVETPQHRNAETENQIFVFQFPNILPQLVLPVKEQPPEDEDADTSDKPESPNEEPHLIRPPKLPATSQHKLSAKAQQVLLESYPPPGIAGKLRVHRSGRITMLWGASDSADEESSAFGMDVMRGTQCEFLQELVVLKQQSPWGDQDVDERGKRKGVAFSLGQVKGKFVVSPDFEQLLKGEKKKKGKGKGRGKEKEKGVEVEVAGK